MSTTSLGVTPRRMATSGQRARASEKLSMGSVSRKLPREAAQAFDYRVGVEDRRVDAVGLEGPRVQRRQLRCAQQVDRCAFEPRDRLQFVANEQAGEVGRRAFVGQLAQQAASA